MYAIPRIENITVPVIIYDSSSLFINMPKIQAIASARYNMAANKFLLLPMGPPLLVVK